VGVPAIHGEGVLGKQVKGAPIGLDTFDLPPTVVDVRYTSDEVTALCPVTGQPDWYTVTIALSGSAQGIESKSLKLYLQSYRNEGLFCEAFADEVARDIAAATGANSVLVTVNQKPRGGIAIEARSTVWKSTLEKLARCDDGESSTIQDVPIRSGTSFAESPREVP
jgi:7-cyano-7-deazaguanine reductase